MSVEILKMNYPKETRMLDTLQASAKRAASMVRQLLTFAKGAEGVRVSVQVAHLLKEIRGIMQGTLPQNIQLDVRHEKQLPTVRGDATQLHQVLLNLCVNARDAMPNGGNLVIEDERREVNELYAASVPDAKPGKYLVLRVKDTGTGMPPEVIEHIFDPFFTTKASDKGTGLGLSTVLGIIKSHGGFVRVDSQPGQARRLLFTCPPRNRARRANTLSIRRADFAGMGKPFSWWMTSRPFGRYSGPYCNASTSLPSPPLMVRMDSCKWPPTAGNCTPSSWTSTCRA